MRAREHSVCHHAEGRLDLDPWRSPAAAERGDVLRDLCLVAEVDLAHLVVDGAACERHASVLAVACTRCVVCKKRSICAAIMCMCACACVHVRT